MLNANTRIGLLVLLLVAFASVGFLTSAQLRAPQSSFLTEEVPVFLDGQQFGSSSNTYELKKHLDSLKSKLPNTNAGGEALPNLGGLVVIPNPETSMKTIALLLQEVQDAAGFAGFAKIAFSVTSSCSDPTDSVRKTTRSMVLSSRPIPSNDLEKERSKLSCLPAASIIAADAGTAYSKRLVKSYRVAATSIEVTEAGSYLVNGQAPSRAARVSPLANLDHPSFSRRVDSAVLRQRPVDSSKLAEEIKAWIELRSKEGSEDLSWNSDTDTNVVLPIIVSGKARFSSLAPVLELIQRSDVSLAIVVDSTQ